MSRHSFIDADPATDVVGWHAVPGHHDRRARIGLVAQHDHCALHSHDPARLPCEALEHLVHMPPAADPNISSSSPSTGRPSKLAGDTRERPVAYRTSVATSAASGKSSHHSDNTGSDRATWSATAAISPSVTAHVICSAFRVI